MVQSKLKKYKQWFDQKKDYYQAIGWYRWMLRLGLLWFFLIAICTLYTMNLRLATDKQEPYLTQYRQQIQAIDIPVQYIQTNLDSFFQVFDNQKTMTLSDLKGFNVILNAVYVQNIKKELMEKNGKTAGAPESLMMNPTELQWLIGLKKEDILSYVEQYYPRFSLLIEQVKKSTTESQNNTRLSANDRMALFKGPWDNQMNRSARAEAYYIQRQANYLLDPIKNIDLQWIDQFKQKEQQGWIYHWGYTIISILVSLIFLGYYQNKVALILQNKQVVEKIKKGAAVKVNAHGQVKLPEVGKVEQKSVWQITKNECVNLLNPKILIGLLILLGLAFWGWAPMIYQWISLGYVASMDGASASSLNTIRLDVSVYNKLQTVVFVILSYAWVLLITLNSCFIKQSLQAVEYSVWGFFKSNWLSILFWYPFKITLLALLPLLLLGGLLYPLAAWLGMTVVNLYGLTIFFNVWLLALSLQGRIKKLSEQQK